MDKILILTDGKAGHENQSKALVRAMGFEFDVVRTTFSFPGAKAFSYVFDNIGVRSCALFRLEKKISCSDGYRAVVGTGSGTFYAVKATAKRLGVKSAVVLYPRGYNMKSFDAIFAPCFDRPAKAANIIEAPANIVANDVAFYEAGVKAFLENGGALPSNRDAVSVIIGGPNKRSSMTASWMKEELDNVFASNKGALFWVTTSRRTPADVEKVVESYPWDYSLIYSKNHFNPIPAFVSLSTKLYVTAESTGMLSEACTCGAARVEVLDDLVGDGGKYRRFVSSLVEGGYVGGSRKIDLSAQFARAKELLGL